WRSAWVYSEKRCPDGEDLYGGFMLRCMLLLISLVAMGLTEPRSNGSQQDGSSEASAEDIKLAREFMEGIKKNIAYRAGAADAISEQVAREHLDAQALLRGFLKLLQRGT